MNQKQLNPHYNQDFVCDNCKRKFYQTTAYSPKLGPGFLTETYCSECAEIIDKKPSRAKKQKNWGTAPINETTENIQSLNIDKRTLKKTGRIHLFATRMKKEWIEQLKSIAYQERLHYNELLEKALECYSEHRKK